MPPPSPRAGCRIVRPALEAFADLDQEVRQSVARIEASPFVPCRDAVRGFVYDVASGLLREVTAT
jgi:carbonic anhydrase